MGVGRLLIAIGVALVATGLLVNMGMPLGRLPGDFTIRRGSFSFYFPLATSVLVSVVLTLIITFVGRR
jgi:hypothetical protein